jgi:hypothetical protein
VRRAPIATAADRDVQWSARSSSTARCTSSTAVVGDGQRDRARRLRRIGEHFDSAVRSMR